MTDDIDAADAAHNAAVEAEMADDAAYSEALEALKNEWNDKALDFLRRVREVVVAAGHNATEPTDVSDDYYRWAFHTKDANGDETEAATVDFTFEIAEERMYDGGRGWGINFGLTISAWGGMLLGQFQPYNFTPDVWVDFRDRDDLNARWALFEELVVADIPKLIEAYKP